jgi:hypothetical protein
MAVTDVCALCGARDSWRHSLLDCSMTRSIWALSNETMVEHMCLNQDPSAKQWLFAMHESLPASEFTMMIVTLWAIWGSRRKAIHEDIFQSPYATHCFVSSYLQEVEALNKPKETRVSQRIPRPSHWIAPPLGDAKINVDATVSRAGGFGAVSAVCRDHHGSFLGARSASTQCPSG